MAKNYGSITPIHGNEGGAPPVPVLAVNLSGPNLTPLAHKSKKTTTPPDMGM